MDLGKAINPRWEGTRGPKSIVHAGGDFFILL